MKKTVFRAAAGVAVALGAATHAVGASFECLLEPTQVVEVRAPVDGVIAAIAVTRGDPIRRGQSLVVLQSDAERASVEVATLRAAAQGAILAARNRVEFTTRKLARLAELRKENFSTQQALDEAAVEVQLAEAELQSAIEARDLARADLKRAQEQLALRTIAAPFNGVVVDRLLNPGDLAESGSGRKPALRVAQIDTLRADVALPAALFARVRAGARASVTSSVGGGVYPAMVRSVDRVIDSASGTFIARLEVQNPLGQVPPGARCTASIDGITTAARPTAAPVRSD